MKIINRVYALIGFIGAIVMIFGCNTESQSFRPERGCIPDEKTAINVAESILSPIYGADTVASERPFSATLVKGVWIVKGYLAPGWAGGVAEIELSKESGKVLRICHGK